MRWIASTLRQRTETWRIALGAQSGRPRWRIWAARIALATALATVLAYFPYRLLDGASARKAAELRLQYERTMEATRALAAENARLRREIDALRTDPSAVEDIARNQLGMVRPGEIIIRIEDGGL